MACDSSDVGCKNKDTGSRVTCAMRICAWCSELIGVAFWPFSGEDVTLTHGVCEDCAVLLVN